MSKCKDMCNGVPEQGKSFAKEADSQLLFRDILLLQASFCWLRRSANSIHLIHPLMDLNYQDLLPTSTYKINKSVLKSR